MNLTRVETTMLVMLAVLIVWTVVLVVKEFKTADLKKQHTVLVFGCLT